ncbi:MAG: hypothetical protein WBD47_18225 [Phormidesmis sp.]
MHKVTASAVILTAITGCSQSSNIPSSQWSFEVPSGNQADSAQSTVADRDGSFISELSADAQPFVEGLYSGEISEKAIARQPTATDPASADILSSSDLDTQALISTVSQPIGTAGVTSSRPDPIAQVRAYLRSSSRPSALANRTPDASLVYLSSSSAPQQSYSPEVFAIPPADEITSSVTNNFVSAVPVANGLVALDTANTESANSAAFAQNPSNVALANTAIIQATTLASAEDNLPHLTPASSVAVLPVETQTIEEIQLSEDVPIGSAILRSLQQSSGTEASAASSLADQVPTPQVPAAQLPTPRIPTRQVPTQLPTDESQVQPSRLNNDASTDEIIADAPVEVETQPTLASLTEGIPYREGAGGASLAVDDLHSRATDSPLLEGLNSAESQSPIYVPISATEPTDAASKLVQEAIAALAEDTSTVDSVDKLALQDTFSSILSSAAFLGSQASASFRQENALSEELIEADTQAETSATSPEEGSVSRSASQLLKTSRRDAALAIGKQISKRRQLITWR